MKPEVSKPFADYYLDKVIQKQKHPFTSEFLYRMLAKKIGSDLLPRDINKLREYARMYEEKLSMFSAGGVFYPEVAAYREKDAKNADDYTKFGMVDVWKTLVQKTVKHGHKFGDRICLPNVFVDGMDLRIGNISYTKVGFSLSKLTRTWAEYFDDFEIALLRDELEYRPGFSRTFRTHNHPGQSGSSCIDSITITILGSKDIRVHVSFRASSLNRMMVMDMHMIHRFCRLVFPIKSLASVKISAYFGAVNLDTLMVGWMGRIKELQPIVDRFLPKKKYNFKAIDLATDFATSKEKKVGKSKFRNTSFGLEDILSEELDTRITIPEGYSRKAKLGPDSKAGTVLGDSTTGIV